MLDAETGEVVNLTLMHEGNEVREFYSQLPRPALVGIEGGRMRRTGGGRTPAEKKCPT